jgi:type IV secretory pathway TraG/TraD family ATPase VirD4
MSRNNDAENNDMITFVLAMSITIFVLILLFPIVIITPLITYIFYKIKAKGYIITLMSMLLIMIISISGIDLIYSFWTDILKNSTECINAINQSIENNQGHIMQSIISSLSKFSYSGGSWALMTLVTLAISGYFSSRLERKRILRSTNLQTIEEYILNKDKEERMENNLSHIKKANKQIESYPENETIIGINPSGKMITCMDNAKHVFICGTTGSGKTVLLSNFVESGINKNYGMLIVDGKGDIGAGSMMDIVKRFSEKYNKKLYIIDINNPESSTKYNPFVNATETICKDMLVNMTDWSEQHYKANTERYLQRLVKLILLDGIPLSFQNIIRHIGISQFEKLSAKLTKEQKQSKEDHILNLELSKSSGKIAEDAIARFATMAESEAGVIFNENGIDIYTALSENAIILFILNPLIYPELSPVFARLILIDAKKAVSKMFGNTENKRTFFIFDEINIYASKLLIDLINKSRSAGVTGILATQSLSDLEALAGDAFKQQIIENCNNYIVLRQNSAKSAEDWGNILGTKEALQLTYQVGKAKNTQDILTSGYGSARLTREYIFHPDEIKRLKTGKAIYVSKDTGIYTKTTVRKPF